MSKNATDLLGNIAKVYESYGGLGALLRSGYFYSAAAIVALSWRPIANGEWSDLARAVLPNLTGFSIAAYALLFSVLDAEQRSALRKPSSRLGGRAPILVLASAITHAIIVQIAALISAIVFWARPLPYVEFMGEMNGIGNVAFSTFGMFLTVYGILLILASVLSIFRLLVLVPPAQPSGKG